MIADWVELSVAVVCTCLAALFAAIESALVGFSKTRAEGLFEDGRRGAKTLVDITQDPAPYVNTTIFLRVLFEIVPVVLVASIVANHVPNDWRRIVFPVAIMVAVSFIVWGVAPRTLGRQHAANIALRVAGPISLLQRVLGPISALMILIGNAITPGRGFSDGPFSSEAELRELVDFAEASDVIEEAERKMIHSVFELGDTVVKEVMVPRTEMVYIEESKTVRQGVSLALRSGFSRIPVIGEDIDDVVGILYMKDCMRRVYDNPQGQVSESVASLMRPAAYCPDSKPIDDLLKEMQQRRNHVVVVIDEFGGTAGIATIEDILEEIVGEIVDEYDEEVAPVAELDGGRFRISARLPVDDLGELFGLRVDDDEVDTVLGLMSKELNTVPIPGSTVVWEGIELVAERGLGRRHQILTLIVRQLDETVDGDPADAVVAALAKDEK